MKKLFVLLALAVVLCSCQSYVPPLYYWAEYENNYYDYYKKQTPESYYHLYESYTAMVNFPEAVNNPSTGKYLSKMASRKTVPPGICAEYGYMLLSPDTPSILKEYYSNPKNFPKKVRNIMEGTDWDKVFAPELLRERGIQMFQKEIELYPESAVFLEPIIKKFSQQ